MAVDAQEADGNAFEVVATGGDLLVALDPQVGELPAGGHALLLDGLRRVQASRSVDVRRGRVRSVTGRPSGGIDRSHGISPHGTLRFRAGTRAIRTRIRRDRRFVKRGSRRAFVTQVRLVPRFDRSRHIGASHSTDSKKPPHVNGVVPYGGGRARRDARHRVRWIVRAARSRAWARFLASCSRRGRRVARD